MQYPGLRGGRRFIALFIAPVGVTVVTLASLCAAQAALLDRVVVSGSREETLLADTPTAIGSVDSETIENQKSITNKELLDTIPGVHMIDLTNEQHSMSIRQPFTTNAVYQYLEDGIPIRPLGVFNHNAINEINLNSLDSIEVLRGPSSSLYGSNAVGGTVNFLTDAPSADPEARVGYQQSSEGYERVEVGASDSWGDFGVRVSGHSATLRDSWRQHNDMDKDAITLRSDYGISPQTLFKFIATYSDLVTDTAGSLNQRDFETNPSVSYQTFSDRADEATRIGATIEHEFSATHQASFTLYGREDSHAQNPNYLIFPCSPPGPSCPTGFNGVINDVSYQSLGVNAYDRLDFKPANSRLVYGIILDQSPSEFVEDRIFITRDPATLVYTGFTQGPRRRDFDTGIFNAAGYFQLESDVAKDTRLVAGARYDTLSYDFDNHLTPSSTTGAPDEKRSFSHTSPKLGIVHDFGAGRSVYANYAQGFVPPEVNQIYTRLDAPTLESATFNNYELGARTPFAAARGEFDVSIYYLEGKNEIVNFRLPTGSSFPQNSGRTRHQGIELGVRYAVTDAVNARVATTFASHKYDEYLAAPALDFSGHEIAQAPHNITNAELDWRFLRNWRAAVEMNYISSYWMNDLNTIRYPGYTIFNLRAAYAHGPLEVWAKLINATDRLYANSASSSFNGIGVFDPNTQISITPGDPRSVFVGIAYRLGKESKS